MIILFQTLHQPLKLKYQCQRQSTWKLAINSLIAILEKGLPVAYKDSRTGSYTFEVAWSQHCLTEDPLKVFIAFLFRTVSFHVGGACVNI